MHKKFLPICYIAIPNPSGLYTGIFLSRCKRKKSSLCWTHCFHKQICFIVISRVNENVSSQQNLECFFILLL